MVINESWFAIDENCTLAISQRCVYTTRINSSSISSQYKTSYKILGPGTTTLIISNEEMDDIMEIVKSLEDSGLLLKGVTKTIENKIKEQRREFLSMLLSTIGIILLRNILSHKGLI